MIGIAALCLPSATAGGLLSDVVFTDQPPAAASAELARRLLTPLELERVRPHLAEAKAQPIDPADERFSVYVPRDAAPAGGYALLVFVPPWTEAYLPKEWPHVLDRRDMIFVSASASGNDADMLDRRIPLALAAYENVRRRYPVDANRTYVAGFSGGSRVALRVAVAYPDLFRGALLDAGSDPLGGDGVVLPPADLFRQFQERSRVVLITGDRDEVNVHRDLVSRRSLLEHCVLHVESLTMPHRGHVVADAAGLERALNVLERAGDVDDAKLARCREDLDREIGTRSAEAATALDGGDRSHADEILNAIDVRYGGLAAPEIASLRDRIGQR